MKVLLVNTPRSPHNSILEHAPDEAKRFIHKRLVGPPLGLLTLAAAIPNHEVVVWDTKGEYDLHPNSPPLEAMVTRLVEEHQPDVVGTTVITSEFYFGVEILQAAKKCNPAILTVIGGVHATLCPEDFTDPAIDVICQGQAAHLFKEVVDAFERKQDLQSVSGIILNTPQGLKRTKRVEVCRDPANADYLVPDRSLLDRWKETYVVGDAGYPSTYMFTSLGCPFTCTFCTIWKEFEGRYMKRNTESIVRELKEMDYEIVRFSDANTIVDVRFIDQLFDRIEEEGIRKSYIMDIRSDTAVRHPRLIEKLARNGLRVVICGFESFREEELKKYNKKSPASIISQAIDVFHDNGIMLRGNYVIPADYSPDDFKAMSEYANSHRVSYAGYTILTPMPGTAYYEEVKDQVTDHDLSKYNFFNCVLPTKLPLMDYYREVGRLWTIKKGEDVI